MLWGPDDEACFFVVSTEERNSRRHDRRRDGNEGRPRQVSELERRNTLDAAADKRSRRPGVLAERRAEDTLGLCSLLVFEKLVVVVALCEPSTL